MNTLKCTCCEAPLSGGLDTFGDVGCDMCWTCYSALLPDRVPEVPTPFVDVQLFVHESADDVDWMRV